jgi:hypothetical protein
VSTLRQSLVRSLPKKGVRAAVKQKARQGFDLAREGFERVKDTTTSVAASVAATVVEGVKEGLSRDHDRVPSDDWSPAAEPADGRDLEPER